MNQVKTAQIAANETACDDRRSTGTGVAMLCLSAVIFSSAGIFTKAVAADAWSVIFWRGLGAIAFTMVLLGARSGLRDEWHRFGRPALLATMLMASGTAAFIPAFKLTSIAHVALIWATAPFVAGVLGWVFLGERPSRRDLVCSLLALGGVTITVTGGDGDSSLDGDLLAFWMTLMMAATMVLYRAFPGTPSMLPTAGSSLVLLAPALIFAAPVTVATAEIGVLLGFGLVFSSASILLAEGARRVPSARAALIGAIETPLAPLWALLILSEAPTGATVPGGTIIMTAVIAAQVGRAPARPCKRPSRTSPSAAVS